MKQSVQPGKKKQIDQPVIITTENQFKPKISERTRRKRQKARDKKYKQSRFASGLDLCGIICLYAFLILAIVIGAGGIALCIVYYSTDSGTVGWKIAGIILGAIVVIIGFILILLTIFKQVRRRPWRYKKEEKLVEVNDYGNIDDDDKLNIENFDDNQTHSNVMKGRNSVEPFVESVSNGKTRETASSPIPDPSNGPLHSKSLNNELIFCPGCNRLHPVAHQCMYSTRIANGFATQIRTNSQSTKQDSIGIQTEEDDEKQKKKKLPHTVIDRSLKYSTTTETQTNVSANPRSNITESIILRRVPIPTAKVVVQQPTTKVMIVKVPNVAGQLVIQPKTESTDK